MRVRRGENEIVTITVVWMDGKKARRKVKFYGLQNEPAGRARACASILSWAEIVSFSFLSFVRAGRPSHLTILRLLPAKGKYVL